MFGYGKQHHEQIVLGWHHSQKPLIQPLTVAQLVFPLAVRGENQNKNQQGYPVTREGF